MKPLVPLAFIAIGAGALAACGRGEDPQRTRSESRQLNAAPSAMRSPSETPAGAADVEQPQTGTNTGRPDSQADLAPGTDGNATPPLQ